MVNLDNKNKCPDGFLYTIVIGDTLYNLTQRSGIDVNSIIDANPGIQPDKLQIGQQICIPAEPPQKKPCPGRLYTVQTGDTLISIAKKFGYTLDALIAINYGINPRNLRIGQQICLPPAPGGGPFPCYGGSIYRVKAGDTLFGIARKYSVTLDQLIEANQHVNVDNLQIGEPICIPR